MKIVAYNTHYGIGRDNRYDLERMVNAVRDADIIALQEIERHYGPPDGPSQPEDIEALMPDYFWVFDAAFDIDGSEKQADGSVRNRRRQHGQMLLSRLPILSKRYYPLPRLRIDETFNMQMGALEAVIAAPSGPLRVYNVHLGSVSSDERQRQVRFLLDLVRQAPVEGGAWTGPAAGHPDRDWSAGVTLPPMPDNAILLGDFNMEAQSPEYEIIVSAQGADGTPLFSDIWQRLNPGKTVTTWHPNPGRPGDETPARLDYCFLTAGLATAARACWVDEDATGSDHQPLWLEIELSQ